jgi:Flp pilus assembly protein TadD
MLDRKAPLLLCLLVLSGESNPPGNAVRPNPWVQKSRAYQLRKFQRERAMREVDESRDSVQRADVLEAEAEALMEHGEEETAVAVLRQTVALDPSRVRALHMLGHLVVRTTGNTTEATELFHRACATDPTSPSALSNLGYAFERWEDDAVSAEALYRRALEADPHNVGVMNNLASLLEGVAESTAAADNTLDAGEEGAVQQILRDARRLYERALAEDPESLESLCNLAGMHQEHALDEAKAAELLAKALSLAPSNVPVMINYGVLMEDWGDNQEVAVKLYERALHLEPANPDAAAALGRVLRIRGDFGAARRACTPAAARWPENEGLLREQWRIEVPPRPVSTRTPRTRTAPSALAG